MHIGLYFGSFNPIHVGHLIIASHVMNETELDRVWLVLSPQNPFKENHQLLNEYDRLNLVRIAIEEDIRLRASDIEFQLPRPSYTVDTLAYLAEKYPDDKFSLIMGSDSFQNLHRWKNAEIIARDHHIYVYERPGYPVTERDSFSVAHTKLDAPLLQLSATQIRKMVKDGKSIRYMVPRKVREEIESFGYYKK